MLTHSVVNAEMEQSVIVSDTATSGGVFRKSSRRTTPRGRTCYLEGARSEGRHPYPMCSRAPSGEI